MLGLMYGSTNQKHRHVDHEQFEKRVVEYQRINQKHPELIPVLINAIDINIEKTRYLVKPEFTFEKFALTIRSYCQQITSRQILFFKINDTLISKHSKMLDVYENHKQSDGFLHISILSEPLISQMIPDETHQDNQQNVQSETENTSDTESSDDDDDNLP